MRWLCRVLWYRVEIGFAPVCVGIGFVLCCCVGGGYAVFCGAVGFFLFSFFLFLLWTSGGGGGCGCGCDCDGRVVVLGAMNVFLVVKYIILL